jgi:hypothetical protein
MTTSSANEISQLRSEILALEKELAAHRSYVKDRLVTEAMLFITGLALGAAGVFYAI